MTFYSRAIKWKRLQSGKSRMLTLNLLKTKVYYQRLLPTLLLLCSMDRISFTKKLLKIASVKTPLFYKLKLSN